MADIVSIGELLVEIMRTEVGVPLNQPGELAGPYPSGAPAIFINAVSKLGAHAGFIGCTGKDAFGELVKSRLEDNGVDVSQIKSRQGLATGVAFVSYDPDGERDFIFHLKYSAAGSLGPEDVSRDFLKGTRLLHVTGSALVTSESSSEACYKAARIVKEGGGRISFDPNFRLQLGELSTIRDLCRPILDLADIILPSGMEAVFLADKEDQDEACRMLLGTAEIVVLKLGADGCKIFSRDLEKAVPPLPIEDLYAPVDPTGAGDCFDAGFIFGLVAGYALEECAQLGNATGAVCITRQGPMEGSVSLDEIRAIERDLTDSR